MASELENLRRELAVERGFVRDGETSETLIQQGLESMHRAPFLAVGEYAVLAAYTPPEAANSNI